MRRNFHLVLILSSSLLFAICSCSLPIADSLFPDLPDFVIPPSSDKKSIIGSILGINLEWMADESSFAHLCAQEEGYMSIIITFDEKSGMYTLSDRENENAFFTFTLPYGAALPVSIKDGQISIVSIDEEKGRVVFANEYRENVVYGWQQE